MVDCYLTTYYNHKTFFGNKREISDKIIENPQDYHIYEGLSTLTNISRYDLPDPDVYRDFFRLNPLYDFPLLSSTCTYFRGCPINRLDVSIAYDLPELVGNYKKSVEAVLHENEGNSPPSWVLIRVPEWGSWYHMKYGLAIKRRLPPLDREETLSLRPKCLGSLERCSTTVNELKKYGPIFEMVPRIFFLKHRQLEIALPSRVVFEVLRWREVGS